MSAPGAGLTLARQTQSKECANPSVDALFIDSADVVRPTADIS